MVKILLEIKGIESDGTISPEVYKHGDDVTVEFKQPIVKVTVKAWIKEE